jgi:hypothetical protein
MMLQGRAAPSVEPAEPLPVANVSFAADAQRGSSSPSNNNQPHGLGFGGMLGTGPLGTGFGVRWFAGLVGLDTRFLLSTATTTSGFGGAFSFEIAPSVIVMLTKPNPDRAVEFRPYAGAGVNYVRAGTNANSTGSPVSGQGVQFFGGLEAQIRQAESMALGFEILYNQRSHALEAAGVPSGTTGIVTFMIYVK